MTGPFRLLHLEQMEARLAAWMQRDRIRRTRLREEILRLRVSLPAPDLRAYESMRAMDEEHSTHRRA